jgi:hypothetical protein
VSQALSVHVCVAIGEARNHTTTLQINDLRAWIC